VFADVPSIRHAGLIDGLMRFSHRVATGWRVCVIRKSLPIFAGPGHVRFPGHEGPVQYAIQGDPARLRPGPARLRGSLSTTAEIAAEAFRAGEGVLTLESGAELRAVMLAHTAGGGEVFVELRI
jgi:hypothetical protein